MISAVIGVSKSKAVADKVWPPSLLIYHPPKSYPDLVGAGFGAVTVPPSSTSTTVASSLLFGSKVTFGNPNVAKLDASHV